MKKKEIIVRNKWLIVGALLLFQIAASSFIAVQGQSRWTLEVRPSLNFPTGKVADARLGIGFGFDGFLSYRFTRHMSIYGGWGWNMFPQNVSGNQYFSDEETGYAFGLQFMKGLPNTEFRYFIKGGPIYNHLELQSGHEVYSDSGHELGWLIEAGLSLPLDYGISLNPGLRYRQLSGNITIENSRQSFNLNSVSAGIGVSKTFR